MTNPPLLLRIRPRPEAIDFRPWAVPLDAHRSVLAWCAERLAGLFPSAAVRVCVVAEWEIRLARACLIDAGWEIAGSAHWADVDAWLNVAERLQAPSFIAAQLEAALCSPDACLRLAAAFAAQPVGLARLAGLPLNVAPELVNVESAGMLRRVLSDERLGSRFENIFELAERARVRDIDGVPCTDVSVEVERFTGVPKSVSFESRADVERLRAIGRGDGDLLRDWTREHWRWLGSERAKTAVPRATQSGEADPIPRVLFVSNPSAFSGAESCTVELVHAFDQEGIATAALVAYRGEFTRRLEAAGCRVFCEDRAFLSPTIDAWRVIVDAVEAWKPAVMHYCGRSGLLPLQIAAAHRVPVVYHGHVPIPAVYTESLGWADRYVAVSESVAQAMRAAGLDGDSITIIGNGINPIPYEQAAARRKEARASLEIPADAFVVLSLNRFSPEKRLPDVVDSIALARDRVPAIRLLMAGDAHSGQATLAEVLERIHHADVKDVVQALGHVADVKPLLAAADALVLSSDSEGLPMAALEAMAAGVPLVATRAGGLADLVGDEGEAGRCGLAVPIGAPAALADALVRLHDDPGLSRRFRRHGAALMRDEYSIASTARRMIELYRAVRAGR